MTPIVSPSFETWPQIRPGTGLPNFKASICFNNGVSISSEATQPKDSKTHPRLANHAAGISKPTKLGDFGILGFFVGVHIPAPFSSLIWA